MKAQFSFEGIIGFNIVINIILEVETPDKDIFVDLIQISLGFFLINIALFNVRSFRKET